MTTIINAVSGTGLTQSADASGVLKVQSNGVTTNALAWVNFNGVTTATIRASFNVSSVTRNSTGDYTVNFTNAMPDANYSASCLSGKNVTADSLSLNNPNTENFATGSLRVVCKYQPSGSSYDVPTVSVAIFR